PRRRARARVRGGPRRAARRRRRHRCGRGSLPDGVGAAGRLREGARLRERRGGPRRPRGAHLRRSRARARGLPAAVDGLLRRPREVGTENAWIVTVADYVSTDDGTGVVHQATAYGEADQQVNAEYGIPVIVSVDEGAQFLDYF